MDHEKIAEEDIIDRYLTGNLQPELESEFEEHFMTCQQCVGELESGRQTMSLLREAHAKRAALDNPPAQRAFWIPLPALGMALALGAAAVFISAVRMPYALGIRAADKSAARPGSQVVQLESSRSGEGPAQAVSAAAATQAFRLRLDLRGVPVYEQYSVRIVDDAGHLVWSQEGIESREADRLEAPVGGARLEPGAYWVRLFGASRGTEAVFLREYALTVGL